MTCMSSAIGHSDINTGNAPGCASNSAYDQTASKVVGCLLCFAVFLQRIPRYLCQHTLQKGVKDAVRHCTLQLWLVLQPLNAFPTIMK